MAITATITPEESGSFLHLEDKFSDCIFPAKVRLPMGWALMIANGSWLRAITPRKHIITTPIKRPNKGDLLHEIKLALGIASYWYHDTLSVAYMLLNYLAAQSGKDICFITATFDDDTNAELHELDDDNSKKDTMLERISQWLRPLNKKGMMNDAIIVLEECPNSSLTIKGQQFKRLHVHILTVLSESEQVEVKETLFRGRLHKHTGVDLRTTWVSKWPYSVLEEIEEDQFGPIPQEAVEPNAEHWLNTYVKDVDYFGKKVKMVHRVLPTCMRAADYLSKSLGTPIGNKGRNYALKGLKGRAELQVQLAERYAAVKREYA